MNTSRRIVTARYIYRDRKGHKRLRVTRLSDKTFFMEHWDNGRWRKGAGNNRGLLYRLAELHAAIENNPNAPVVITEGEKDADNLAELGIATTTNAGGALAWNDRHSAMLPVKRVAICPDNDEAGLRRVDIVARSLKKHGVSSIKVVHLPNLQPGGDVSDWIASGGTFDDFMALVEDAEEWSDRAEDSGSCDELDTNDLPPLTDVGNAERFYSKFGNVIRHCTETGKWMLFNGRYWEANRPKVIRRAIKLMRLHLYDELLAIKGKERARFGGLSIPEPQKALIKHMDKSQQKERISAMLALAEAHCAIPVERFDADPWLLNCRNGTLNLKDGTLRPHSENDSLTHCLNIDYDSTAKCSLWIAFVHRIMGGNEALISFLKRAVGYTITGDTSEQCLFFCFGNGANGKTVFLLTIRSLLGEQLVCQMDMADLDRRSSDRHPTRLARLKGKRCAIGVESESGRMLSEVIVKQLTGEDIIAGRFMRQDFFEFSPNHKLWLASNHRPVIKDVDEGIWRRFFIIPFTETIPEAERDKHLAAKLKAELPGILAWAVEGCSEWQRDGINAPAEVLAATKAYREEMDVIGQFIADCLVFIPAAWITNGELRGAHRQWCEANGTDEYRLSELKARIVEMDAKAHRKGRDRGLRGVRLRTLSDGYSSLQEFRSRHAAPQLEM